MTIVDNILDQVNDAGRKLFVELPDKVFVQIQDLKTLVPDTTVPLFVLYKYTRPIDGLKIEIENTHPLSIGKLHYLCSSKFHFGYLIELPRYRHIVSKANCFGISKRVIETEVEANVEFSDSRLTIFSGNNDAILFTDNKHIWVSREGYHGSRK